MMSSTQIVERRNYTQLKWKSHYHTNYQQNNNNHSTLICQCKNKKYLNKKCDCGINWNWYLYKNDKTKNIPTLRGHSICDIGNNKLITIGNKVKNDTIDIYQVEKDFNKYKKLKSFGNSPTQRFAHSAEYIPSIHAILFFGGFDSKMNYNDARLLFLNNMKWFTLIYNANIEVRAYHSTASRIIYDNNLKENKFEMYLFGGQFCNGGPYEYHNDLFKFTFYGNQYSEINSLNNAINNEQNPNDNAGWFQCDEVHTYGTKPRTRAQCYLWINDNKLYVFGGCYDTATLNDLWMLDLNSLMWSEIKYTGLIKAPMTHYIKPMNFRIHPARKPCYFDAVLNKLIVIHFGYLNDIQNKYVKFRDNIAEFEERMNKFKQGKKKKRQLLAATFIFMFDMISYKWDIVKMRQLDLGQVPPNIPLTRSVRIGKYLALVGGGYLKSQLANMRNKNKSEINILNRNHMQYLYFLKLPSFRIHNTISWSRERLIWIAHLKNVKTKYKNKTECFFYKMPKQMILLIISFLNITLKYNIINTKSDMRSMNLEMETETKDDNDEDDLLIMNNKMQTLMGYEQNNNLLKFNNKNGELSPESVLIKDMELMDNTQDAPPVKFVFDKQIVENINYVNDNNNKIYKSSPMHKRSNAKMINDIGNDANKADSNENFLLKQGITMMGYCVANNNENVSEDDNDINPTNGNTKGEVLLGYIQHTKK